MRIREAYRPHRLGLSFELFPPKNDAADAELFRHLPDLMAFLPDFVTCTYGAGGSTRAKTLDVVERVHRRFGCTVAAHLTCVGSTVDDLCDFLREAVSRGIENIVALRGDPPKGEAEFRPVEGGLCYANELVSLVRRKHADLGVAVAGYPETHREAASPEADLANLKRKVDAGADCIITQLFYDNGDFFRFRERVDALGIGVPLVPGVLPVTNLAQIKRIASLCGARLPQSFIADLEANEGDNEAQFEVGVEFATRQVQELIDDGIPGLHFYVLNKSPATCRVLSAVGWPPTLRDESPTRA